MRAVLKRAPTRALAILGFHNITPTFSQPHLAPAFPRRFERLCRLLRRRYEMVTISEGMERLMAGEVPPRPLLALIFDDGYADTRRTVMPILSKLGIPGTSYVVVDCLATGRLPWYEELGRLLYRTTAESAALELPRGSLRIDLARDPRDRHDVFWDVTRRIKADFPPDMDARLAALARDLGMAPHDPGAEPLMMDRDDARALLANGFEVGCHSRTHPILPALDDAALDDEIIASRDRLAGLLDHEVASFCYPNGDNDVRCLERAERAGYVAAVSCAVGANRPESWRPHQLKRAWMSEEIGWAWPYHTCYRVHATLVEDPAEA